MLNMLESNTFFTKMIDELVEFSEYDPELSDGIKWIGEWREDKPWNITEYSKDGKVNGKMVNGVQQ